jgi:hypothetical protein
MRSSARCRAACCSGVNTRLPGSIGIKHATGLPRRVMTNISPASTARTAFGELLVRVAQSDLLVHEGVSCIVAPNVAHSTRIAPAINYEDTLGELNWRIPAR